MSTLYNFLQYVLATNVSIEECLYKYRSISLVFLVLCGPLQALDLCLNGNNEIIMI